MNEDTLPVVTFGVKENILAQLFLGTMSALLIIIAFYSLLGSGSVNSSWPNVVFWSFVFWLVCFIVCSYQLLRTAYLFISGYVASLVVFHLGHVIPHATGLIDIPFLTDPATSTVYFKAGWATILALASLTLGFSLGIKKQRGVHMPRSMYLQRLSLTQRTVWWHGVGLLVISIAFFFLTIATIGNIFAYSRAQIFGGVGDTRGFNMFLMLYPAGAVLMMVGAVSKRDHLLAGLLALFGFMIIMFLGYRSAVLFPALVGAVLWIKVGKKIPVVVVCGMLVLVMVLVPMVRHLRTIGSYDSITLDDFSASMDQVQMLDTFTELGGTGGILARVIEWVPDEDDYRYGMTYVQALKGAIPNIGFSTRKSSRALIDGAANKLDMASRLPPADWFVFKVNRWKFDRGQGTGFTAIGEAYLNFGYIGIVSFFALLGFIFARVEQINFSISPILILVTVACTWPLIKTVRNEFATFIKPASFTLIIMFFWHMIIRFQIKKGDLSMRKKLSMSLKNRAIKAGSAP